MEKVVNLSLKIDSCLFQYTKNKQLLSDFQAQIGADPKQPEAQLENGVAYKKKTCIMSECGNKSNDTHSRWIRVCALTAI